MDSSEKVVTRSFRIDKQPFEKMKLIAKERNDTVNTVLREIVDQYVNFEYACSKIRVAHIDMTLLKFLTDGIPKDKLSEYANTYARTIAGSLRFE